MDCSNVSDRGGRRCPASRDDATGQIWGLYSSGKQTQPDPVSRDDVAAQIWGLYRSGKQTSPDPALRPPPRHKSTKNQSKQRSGSEILSLFFSAPKSGDNLTKKMASFPAMSSSTPIFDPSTQIRCSRTTTTSRTSTRELGFFLVGLFPNFGPSSKLWPNTKKIGFKSETTWPRSALSCLLSSTVHLMSRFSIISGRRLHQRWKSDSMRWPCYYHQRTLYNRSFTASKRLPNLNYQDASSTEEDWKKTHVDSKKILAQPHQSAATYEPSTSLSKSRFTLFNISLRSLLKICCSTKNGRRRHSILVSSSSFETCIHQCQNLINRVDGLSPNATLSVASSMEKIIKSSYASFARAIYDHKLIRNFMCEFLKVSKDFPTVANSLKMCIVDYSLSLYLFFSCIGLLLACMNFPLLRI